MTKYWFYLEPDVFIIKKLSKVILYNSLSKDLIHVNPSFEILHLIDKLLNPNELYVIQITSIDLENKQISTFIHLVRKSFFGDLIVQTGNIKPVIIPPILKIHKSKDTIHKDPGFNIGKNILSYLNELVLYINGKCGLNCNFCSKMYHQFDFCTKNTGELSIIDIEKLINISLTLSSCKIIITGGNIFDHSAFLNLVEIIKQKRQNGLEIWFGIHYLNLDTEKLNLIVHNSTINLYVYVVFPIDQIRFVNFIKYTNSISDRITYVFVTKEESELILVQKIIDKNQIENNSVIKPFYNERNIKFFEEYVFFDENDIQNNFPNKQDYFSKQTLNTYDFGKLIVNSKGEIQANTNYPIIGNIQDNFADVIYKEFIEGKSWFRIREQEPCNNCTYQWLCPSPSNYEIAIDRPNLCYVKS